jgi:hypothetical protein
MHGGPGGGTRYLCLQKAHACPQTHACWVVFSVVLMPIRVASLVRWTGCSRLSHVYSASQPSGRETFAYRHFFPLRYICFCERTKQEDLQ